MTTFTVFYIESASNHHKNVLDCSSYWEPRIATQNAAKKRVTWPTSRWVHSALFSDNGLKHLTPHSAGKFNLSSRISAVSRVFCSYRCPYFSFPAALTSLSPGRPMQMWMPETSWYSEPKIHKRHLFGCVTVSKESLRQWMTSTQHTTWKLSFRHTWPNKSSSYSYCWLFPKADHSWPFCWKIFLWRFPLFLTSPNTKFLEYKPSHLSLCITALPHLKLIIKLFF